MDINKKRSLLNPQRESPSLYLALGRGICGCVLAVDFGGPELIVLFFDRLIHRACALKFVLDCRYRSCGRGGVKCWGLFPSRPNLRRNRVM